MRCVAAAALAACLLSTVSGAQAAGCAGRPQALGVSRVLAVDPAEHRRVGSMQYGETLPLADKEVVLTFDDGPLPKHTADILDALAAECVKATFFVVGRMARAYPEWVRRLYNSSHTVATHTHRHLRFFDQLALDAAVTEIEDGIAATTAALGDARALAPFFRFPGLRRFAAAEEYLAGRGIMAWSADIPADDWKPLSPEEVTAVALERLERKGRGVLLLHDIQERTALALPGLLRELKARGYRVVHVVPTGVDRPKTVTEPAAWAAIQRRPAPAIWPVTLPQAPQNSSELPSPSALSFGFPDLFAEAIDILPAHDDGPPMRVTAADLGRPGEPALPRGEAQWPAVARTATDAQHSEALPAPSASGLELSKAHAPDLVTADPPDEPAYTPEAAVQLEPKPRRQTQAVRPRNEVQLRGRIDDGERSRTWMRRLNWFH